VDLAALPVLEIDYDKDLERLKTTRKYVPEDEDYSDWEEGYPRRVSPPPPAFFQSNSISAGSEMVIPPIPGSVPVPATPSLIRAVERIVSAQREVFGIPQPQPQPWPLPSRDTKRKPGRKRISDATALTTLLEVKPIAPPLHNASTPAQVQIRPEGLPRTHTSPNVPVAQDEEDDVDLEQGQPPTAERAPMWDEFWQEVRAKAFSAGRELDGQVRDVPR
jgi:hypothetical protein